MTIPGLPKATFLRWIRDNHIYEDRQNVGPSAQRINDPQWASKMFDEWDLNGDDVIDLKEAQHLLMEPTCFFMPCPRLRLKPIGKAQQVARTKSLRQ